MLWQDPFEHTQTDLLDRSNLRDANSLRDVRRTERFSPIAWNPRLGIYEGQEPVPVPPPIPGKVTQSVVVFAAIWSLCELPLELLSTRTNLEGAACITAKLIWLCLSLWALSGGRVARTVFAFFCSASAFSIAFALMTEDRLFAVGYCLSAVECAAKTAAFLLIVCPAIWRAAR